MSPSTEIMLNVTSVISERASCSSALSIAASVVMKESIVAMFGWIMPDPLAIAPKRTFLPPISTSVAHALEYVSVVMMALPASTLPSLERAATASLTPCSSFSIGRFTPMTPVEATRTSPAAQPSASAAISVVRLASFMPCSPVQAFAQPALATMARALPSPTASLET